MTSPIRDLFHAGLLISQSPTDQLRLQVEIETDAVSCPLKQSLLAALERLTVTDLGVTPAFFASGVITFVTIHNSQEFWLGFFCMPAGTFFPLHDHPRMIGCSRLLTGRILYRALNVVGRTEDGGYTAEVGAEYELVGCGTEMLTGNVRNVHEIAAVDDSVLLDFFVPYYDPTRECKYFRATEQREGLVLLREMSQPNIPCRVKTYRGLPIH